MNILFNIIILLRLKQWIKNLFVFAPLLFSVKFLEKTAIYEAFVAFLLFCVGSSAGYIFNDIKDINRDRLHPKKSLMRPLASGALTIEIAKFILIIFYCFLGYIYLLKPKVVIIILAYIILNILYTLLLKNKPVLDIFSIAVGFVLRVYAGAIAIKAPVSAWMLVTVLCLALFLGAVKRIQELQTSGYNARKVLAYYSLELVNKYAEISGTCAIVFYSMFVLSNKPQLDKTIPFVLFGVFRYWFIVNRKKEGESPTDALLNDWQLIATVLLWALTCGFILLKYKN